MTASHFAVVGRVLEDPDKFDNKVLRWYLDRGLPVTCVRPKSERYDNSKPVEGVKVVDDVVSCPGAISSQLYETESNGGRTNEQSQIPDLPNTSVSFIISPKLGLEMLKQLYPDPPTGNEPRAVWFQPGAESDDIYLYCKRLGITEKLVSHDHACVLVSGDDARKQAQASRKSLL